MEITWQTLLIILPLTGLAGFVDAVAGGGGLVAIPAYMIAGLPAHYAIGTHKLNASMGLSVAVYRYARSGYIRWKLAGLCVIAALIGGSLGAKISLLLSDHYFKILMLFILPAVAFIVMKGRVLSDDKEEYSYPRTAFIACAIALTLGIYDGFYGPGSGTFIMLLLAGMAHLRLNEAAGTARVINLCTCISSMTVFMQSGKVLVALGIAAGITNMIGAWIGTKMFDKGGARIVKPLILVIVIIFFIKIITELTG